MSWRDVVVKTGSYVRLVSNQLLPKSFFELFQFHVFYLIYVAVLIYVSVFQFMAQALFSVENTESHR